jgi:hypothetical protein
MGKIVAAQTPVGVGGGHDLWVLFDDNGIPVQQINGFALVDGKVNTAAVSGKILATYDYRMPDFNASSPQVTVFEGPIADLMKYWDAGKSCADLITQHNFDYSLLSQNSNSVYTTVGNKPKIPPPPGPDSHPVEIQLVGQHGITDAIA